MIGNDIVDLKRAGKENNWQRKGFVRKVFLEHERDLIAYSNNQDLMVWLLWSMKEAAYKAHQRQYRPGRSLNWHRFSCHIGQNKEENISGKVLVGDVSYQSTSKVSKDHIHTLVQNDFDGPVIFSCWKAPSAAVKAYLLNYISRSFAVPQEELAIEKDSDGIPSIFCGNTLYFDRFSFSDHGKFSGFSLSLKIP